MQPTFRLFATLLFVACSAEVVTAPGGDGDGDGAGLDPLSSGGTLRGRVWAPNNSPALAGNQAIGIGGAVVYVTSSRPAAIPAGAYCEPCQAVPPGAAISDHLGNFELGGAPLGTQWLVVQKAQFRIETQIEVKADQSIELPAEATTLPAISNYAMGYTIPRIAVATGNSDPLEDVLAKIGLGELSPAGEMVSPLSDIDVYRHSGDTYGTPKGTIAELLRDGPRMRGYHIIMIPCSGSSEEPRALLREPQVLRNVREFVKAGGKLYVTDYSAEFVDNVFPAQVVFEGATVDTPASAYNPTTETWNVNQFGSGDGAASYTATDAIVKDADLAKWLGAQTDEFGATINPNRFTAGPNFNIINGLTPVLAGQDDKGQPVTDTPKVWVAGTPAGRVQAAPLSVSFQPTGCGRVLYTTYHTTNGTHTGLAVQEKVLLYLMMEIGVCVENPIVIE